ncbi:S-adenosyl-L-methionine-dependent methyltransferase [Schizophyllum amplum]|uniref:S-adenosyl-L-methionine-dependent methyltransferase n=1 Tax=Schizophyllum amplum TaxID=97359 RepID=A0A550C4Q2_9AGAR|nr:S-adenosyl-L-methionine-dependent methyltransferase [Auriculariopsis ampla]TRM60948.1 S-adenosyl-L-methionine-dependent methyltransferase [Auriculariopsis ampla]
MNFSAILGLLTDLYLAFKFALVPSLLDTARQPSLLIRPIALSRIFMAHVWTAFGPGVDENSRLEKQKLITPYAHGVVLDAGAGHGHTMLYLDPAKVTKYVAVEPNADMHQHIRRKAAGAGFNEADGTLVLLGCGIEDIGTIRAALNANGPCVDTIVSVLTLCTVPEPQRTIQALVDDILRPGGAFLFYEHVLSHRADVAWWQQFWAPIWQIPFDGCRLDRPTHLWISEVRDSKKERTGSVWAAQNVWGKDGETEDTLFWHRAGNFVKRLD